MTFATIYFSDTVLDAKFLQKQSYNSVRPLIVKKFFGLV